MKKDDEKLPLPTRKLAQLIDSKCNGNVSEFSMLIGKSQQVINRLFNIDKRSGKYPSLSDGTIQAVCRVFNLERSYFYNALGDQGVYDVFSPTGNNKMDEIRDSVSLMSYKVPNKNLGIPLIPTSAMAGVLGGDSITINEWDIEDYYVIPAFKKSDFCIRVDGDSMQPKYLRGDILACTRVPLSNLWFQWGKIYIIDTRQGVLVKHVEKGTDDEHIKLVSDNPDYKPFEIPTSELFGLAIVNGVIRVE